MINYVGSRDAGLAPQENVARIGRWQDGHFFRLFGEEGDGREDFQLVKEGGVYMKLQADRLNSGCKLPWM